MTRQANKEKVELAVTSDQDLSQLTTFGLRQSTRQYIETDTFDRLVAAIEFARAQELPFLIMGGGSNLVFLRDYPGLVIRMTMKGIEYKANRVSVAAGENWHRLVEDTIENKLYGLENLSLIPGTAGAAPVQNIGAYGVELATFLKEVEVLDTLSLKKLTIDRQDCRLGYRDSIFKRGEKGRYIILRINLELDTIFNPRLGYEVLRDRVSQLESKPDARELSRIVCDIRKQRLPDPAEEGNAGSFFKNPLVSQEQKERLLEQFENIHCTAVGDSLYKLSAAWLIERAGLKGYSVGDAAVSDRHALVLINRGKASATELQSLYKQVIKRVDDLFGVELEPEPELVF